MRSPLEHARRPALLVLGALAALVAPDASGEDGPPSSVEAVPSVDLERYSGLWYEVARLPNRFQEDCACCVTASYRLRENGRLAVVNTCQTADGKPKSVEGEAKLATEDGPTSKLKVRFAPRFLSFLRFVWADYWILHLAEDYSHALVGSPDRKYLWLLSRNPMMEDETYAKVMERAAGMGFDIDQLQRTAHEQ